MSTTLGYILKWGKKKKKKKLATESEVRTFLEKTLQLSQGGSVSFFWRHFAIFRQRNWEKNVF